jgi:hypothetical protein
MEGYITEQFFFFSWPYAYTKSQKFIAAVKEIWANLPVSIDRMQFDLIGINGIHGAAAPEVPKEYLDNLNEIGIRVALKHKDERTGKMAIASITALGLNGPPGVISIPGWGKMNRAMLSLWPTLVPRELITEEFKMHEL